MYPLVSHTVHSQAEDLFLIIFQLGLNSFLYIASPLHLSLDTRASYEI